MAFSKIFFFFGWIFSTIFVSLRIFWGCRFDAQIGPLSTYEVFRAIPALLHPVSSRFRISFFLWTPFFFFRSWDFPEMAFFTSRSEICSKQGEGVPESSWKPHKWKEDQFLLRNYTPKKIWAKKIIEKIHPEKYIFLKNFHFWKKIRVQIIFFRSWDFFADFFSKLRFFRNVIFKNIFFSAGFFRLFFFRSEFFGGVVSKQKMVLFRFMGFSGRFRHSFAPFGPNWWSGVFSVHIWSVWTKEVFGLH